MVAAAHGITGLWELSFDVLSELDWLSVSDNYRKVYIQKNMKYNLYAICDFIKDVPIKTYNPWVITYRTV